MIKVELLSLKVLALHPFSTAIIAHEQIYSRALHGPLIPGSAPHTVHGHVISCSCSKTTTFWEFPNSCLCTHMENPVCVCRCAAGLAWDPKPCSTSAHSGARGKNIIIF